MRARTPEAALAVVLRLLVAQRLADTAGLPGADRQGVYEPQELSGVEGARQARAAGRAAVGQAAPRRAGGRAGAARAGMAGRAGGEARRSSATKLAAGEPVRCECCLRTDRIAPTRPPRRTAASSTPATASSNGAAPTTSDDADEEALERS